MPGNHETAGSLRLIKQNETRTTTMLWFPLHSNQYAILQNWWVHAHSSKLVPGQEI